MKNGGSTRVWRSLPRTTCVLQYMCPPTYVLYMYYIAVRGQVYSCLYTCPRTNMYMWRRCKKLSRYVLLYVCPRPAICVLVLLYICIRILI
jgi:hypothetical protein